MTLDTWFIYVATVLALMSTPGPSQLLMLSNSARNGFRRGTATAFGDLTANAIQMLLAGLGLGAVLAASAGSLLIIKWLGVAYLLFLGIKMIRKSRIQENADSQPQTRDSLKSLWLQGFLTSAANPKAVVFFAALFPQFIDPGIAIASQLIILSVTYLIIDAIFLSIYGISASWIAEKLKGNTRTYIDRVGGSFVIAAAILLGVKTVGER